MSFPKYKIKAQQEIVKQAEPETTERAMREEQLRFMFHEQPDPPKPFTELHPGNDLERGRD